MAPGAFLKNVSEKSKLHQPFRILVLERFAAHPGKMRVFEYRCFDGLWESEKRRSSKSVSRGNAFRLVTVCFIKGF
jgi:hypothetical protein